jgi:ABC-type nickel/cobalt efflux system permease component RcnA
MEFYTLLFFGCIVGMQHALEADHLAAVAALSNGKTSRHALVLRGSAWGLGHTVTLLAICSVLLFLGESISARAEAMLEFVVGMMVVFLGASVLYRLWRRRAHFHFHKHEHGLHHLHIHAHIDDAGKHADSPHDHEHRDLGLGRSLLVGMMHGAAGSAALLVLAAAADSFVESAAYVLAFGAGSIIGMAALSFVASYPLRLMEQYATWLNKLAFACIGCAAIAIGVGLMGGSWSLL